MEQEVQNITDITPTGKFVIVAVLNWGLGHATRTIPIIIDLIKKNNVVIIASDGEAESYLMQFFPTLQFVSLPAYNIRYPFKSLILNLLSQTYKAWSASIKEKKLLNKYIKKNNVDLIISDSRFGCFHKDIPSVFVTHQIKPYHQYALIRKAFTLFMASTIKKFSTVWVPDFENKEIRLSGTLSDSEHLNTKCLYIGPQSRFSRPVYYTPHEKGSILVILSGPEPQRTSFEKILLQKFKSYPDKKIVLIRGKIHNTSLDKELVSQNIKIIDFMIGSSLEKIIQSSETIICRSGYSSIMDLNILGKRAILVPTPGQSEQEYLAHYMHDHFGWQFIEQNKILDLIL